MYSAVFFGWPVTTISPKPGDVHARPGASTWPARRPRASSPAAALPRPLGQRVRRPAEPAAGVLGVERGLPVVGDRLPACRGVDLGVEADLQLLERRADVGRGDARRELGDLQHPDAGQPVGQALEVAVPADPGGDVVVEVAAHAGQLAGGVEVADERHVRVGRRAVTVEQGLPGQQQDLGEPDLRRLQPHPVRADPEVAPPGVARGDRHLRRRRRCRRRRAPAAGRPPARGRTPRAPARAARFVVAVEATIFGPDRRAGRPGPGAQLVDRRLEQPDRGAERPGDEVQLVLDDQVRRPEPDDRAAGHRGPAGLRVVPVRAAGPRVEVGVPVAVPRAPLADPPEQRRRRSRARAAGRTCRRWR